MKTMIKALLLATAPLAAIVALPSVAAAQAAGGVGIAMKGGMKTLHQDSIMKVKEGHSSLAEALSTVPQDMELREGAMVR